MAAKKRAKAAVKASRAECACCGKSDLEAKLPIGLLIILGALGLASALGYLKGWAMFNEFFPFVWSVLVLVIGITSAMEKSNCTC